MYQRFTTRNWLLVVGAGEATLKSMGRQSGMMRSKLQPHSHALLHWQSGKKMREGRERNRLRALLELPLHGKPIHSLTGPPTE